MPNYQTLATPFSQSHLQVKVGENADVPEGFIGTFAGYASTFGNVDQVGDIIVEGAFDKTIKRWRGEGKKPKFLYSHDPSDPRGVIDEMEVDAKGLYIKGMFVDTPKGDELYRLAKTGIVDAFSIGFYIKEQERNKEGLRLIKEVDLVEISMVTFPANQQALVTGVKSELPRDVRSFEKFLCDAGYSRSQARAIAGHGIKAVSSDQWDAGSGNQRDAGNDGQCDADAKGDAVQGDDAGFGAALDNLHNIVKGVSHATRT